MPQPMLSSFWYKIIRWMGFGERQAVSNTQLSASNKSQSHIPKTTTTALRTTYCWYLTIGGIFAGTVGDFEKARILDIPLELSEKNKIFYIGEWAEQQGYEFMVDWLH